MWVYSITNIPQHMVLLGQTSKESQKPLIRIDVILPLDRPRRFWFRGITMHFIWTLIIGLIIGAVAKLLMPGKDPGGIIVTMLLGVAGSLVATYLGQALGWYPEGSSAGFIASVIGAMILLFLYRLFRGRKTA
jgi:uncharacterized membrane protein YeaQ/YmgE (transglycosylase-associated protein family)